jgi:hypothetical protein
MAKVAKEKTQTKVSATVRSKTTSDNSPERSDILDDVHTGQETAVDVARSCVDSVAQLIPRFWDRPIADGAPSPNEVTNTAFDITRKVINAQHDISQKVAKSLTEPR